MNILVLGGDGYLGWPTAMHLSSHGHNVAVVDNYLRRNLCTEQKVNILHAVPKLEERVAIWKKKSGNTIRVFEGDLNDWGFVAEMFQAFVPDGVVHYAEQPSAPYSMINRETAFLTLQNNLGVTFNTIQAVRQFSPDAHIVKLGTMGEYGTPNIDIEEGWIDIHHKGRSDKFLFPRQAGSLYHTTKIQDTDLLWFYVRVWGLRVTDLMQGPVYGLKTDENDGDPTLFSFFNYDEIFGTVLNRFIVQAVAGYPLTIYGKGGQTRGYLNLKDTLNCVRLSLDNPANAGELRVFNQFTETFSVNQLAELVRDCGERNGVRVSIENKVNPRKELEEHYYNPTHTGLLELGLEPNYLNEAVLDEMFSFVSEYKNAIEKNTIFSGIKWN